MTYPSKPEFATNGPGQTVAGAINAHLAYLRQQWRQPPSVAIASGYFNLGGFSLLADELEQAGSVRLLLGAEPASELRLRRLSEPSSPKRAQRAQLNRALEDHRKALEDNRDLLGFTYENDATARRLIQWLRSGKVEVRRLSDRFLHGKAYMITDHHEGVIAGSSNFTYAGLARNEELNLGQYQTSTVENVCDWFEDLWAAAQPFDLAELYDSKFRPHSPHLIYLRMLWERYGAEVEQEADATQGGVIHLTGFQNDGVWRARRFLQEHQGVLIADEVGLGKTFIAGKLIEEAALERRQRVLVIAPATLRDGPWRQFGSEYNIPFECRSFEDVTAGNLNRSTDEYSLVVVDEAHNVRNPGTYRAEALRQLLAGRYPKDLVLMTATPVNNSLWDIYYLLILFLRNDAAFVDMGIPSLSDHFKRAMALNPDDLTPEHLFDVLDAVTVRRTRPFVKRFYPLDAVTVKGRRVPITFPTPRVRKLSYNLEEVLPGFFMRFAAALDVDDGTAPDPAVRPNVLTLARYAPSRYSAAGAESHEVQLAGLLRSGLLKRFESSSCAFARTCRKMAESHDAFLGLLDKGKVATGKALTEWAATDTDDPDEVDEYLGAHLEGTEDAAGFDVALLRSHVDHDRHRLREMAAEAEQVTRRRDPKLASLQQALIEIAKEAEAEGVGEDDTRNKGKVLIFTYFADTVEWIEEFLLDAVARVPELSRYSGRVTSLTGSEGNKASVLWGFAPETTDSPHPEDVWDVVVCTDVLAEGVNLQQARHIVNYDLPWNPMRLVQRHGRIDRIGSKHSEVFLRCIFPDQQLDDLLGLEASLQTKLKRAAASVGVSEVLPGSKVGEVTLTEAREEIDRIRAEDATYFEQAGGTRGAQSGEEYRQELRKALEDQELGKLIRELPWGSGSGMAVGPDEALSFVFCIKVGDHPTPIFRTVTLGDEETSVVGDTLACLDMARPFNGSGTARVMDDAVYEQSFAAWQTAQQQVVRDWNHYADPLNISPAVPPAMQRASQLVRDHAANIEVEEKDRIVESLEAPYPERMLRKFRELVNMEDSVRAAELIIELRNQFGLQPPPPPKPLPEVNLGDVHLLCWTARIPG